MNKLFIYSKIASCAVFLIAIVQILHLIISVAHNDPTLSSAPSIVNWNTDWVFHPSILIWFGLIAMCSVKGSSLKLPSFLGVVFSIIPLILYIIIIIVKVNIDTLLILNKLINICDICVGIGFIWISRFFNRSLVKVLAIIFGVILIISSIYYCIPIAVSKSNLATVQWASLFPIIARYIALAMFLFFFSKSK